MSEKGAYVKQVEDIADAIGAVVVTRGNLQDAAVAALGVVHARVVNLIDPAMTGVEVKRAVLALLDPTPPRTDYSTKES